MIAGKQTSRAAQREGDHQRWADDGGNIPADQPEAIETIPHSPWPAIVVAVAAGFAVGWLTRRT